MNQSKFTWAIVIPIFIALLFGIVSFFGANFLNVNSGTVWGMPPSLGCAIMALVMSLLIGLTSIMAIMLKRVSNKFKISFIVEVILLFLFGISALFFSLSPSSPYVHFFTVMDRKTEIKNDLNSSLNQAENMFTAYEKYAKNRLSMYEADLSTVVRAKNVSPTQYVNFGFERNGISDETQINTKIFTLEANLFPSNYTNSDSKNGIKNLALSWIAKAKHKVNFPLLIIGIDGVINNMNSNTENWLNDLIKLSKYRQQNEQADNFDYRLGFDNVKDKLEQKKAPNFLALAIAVLMFGVILMSWYGTNRHSKFPGFKVLFDKGEKKDNVL